MLHRVKMGIFVCAIFLCTAFAVKTNTIDALLHNPADPSIGNANSNVTVVEFFDYQCPHCVNMTPILDAVIKKNPQVRFVFKELPTRGSMSRLAARAGLAANKQNKYYDFHYALLMRKKPLNNKFILELAQAQGLDPNKLQQTMNEAAINQQLDATLKLAKELKVPGTPAFFISKTNPKPTDKVIYVLGEMTQKKLQQAIDKQEAPPKKLKPFDKLG